MKKIILATVLGLALFAVPMVAEAAPPGFYNHGRVTTFSNNSAVPSLGYSLAPYTGYRTFNYSGIAATPWGFGMYNYGGTYTRPIVSAPYHSVYWNPYAGYQYSTGYLNTPTYFSTWGWGW
jgi:hypothetical protein